MALEAQRVISSILRLALRDDDTDNLLDDILGEVVSLEWATFGGRGSIMLRDGDRLEVGAWRGPMCVETGACGGPALGQCVCGTAASSRTVVFARSDDEVHTTTSAVPAHAHYAVPILYGDEVLGVLTSYMGADHQRSEIEVAYLQSIADALALALVRKRAQAEREELAVQYLHAQRMEAVGRLAGGVAHDFNNIISVVQCAAGLLAQDLADVEGLGDVGSEDLDEILTTCARASDLTRQLLAFARKEPNHPVSLRVDRALGRTQKMLRRTLGGGVDVDLDLGAPGAHVFIDRGRWEQVILNLAVNARDAMPGGGTLCLRTRVDAPAEPGDLPAVAVEICDTGNGIPADVQARVFEPFFTTKKRQQGTGLGLSTVREIVEEAGGVISLRSEVGRGTCFRISLPLVEHRTAPDQATPAPAPVRGQGATVLVVEDDDAVRRVVVRVLRRSGFSVLEATNAEAAVLMSRGFAGTIDLLLTDVVMPGMSGPELAALLRKLRPALRVIFVSGNAAEALEEGALDLAGATMLAKPFTDAALVAAVSAGM